LADGLGAGLNAADVASIYLVRTFAYSSRMKNESESGVTRRTMFVTTALALVLAARPASLWAQAPAAIGGPRPNLAGQIERPLRYRPEGPDFVIDNGGEFFNRALYGGNSAFRVDGGDKPEFVLYLPGRGGNLRLAVRTGAGARWLHEAAEIVTRYRPGELHYELRDPVLGAAGVLRIAALAYAETEGLIVRAEAEGVAAGAELIWIYGGVTGERGVRDGDIGTERVPISDYFQFKPEFAADNVITRTGEGFQLTSTPATIVGAAHPEAAWTVVSADSWNRLDALTGRSQTRPRSPIVLGRVALTSGAPIHISLQRVGLRATTELDTYRAVSSERGAEAAPLALPAAYVGAELPARFAETAAHFAALRAQVRIETPDPFLNAAMGALNVAADAVWDAPQQAIMHGAIAWRAKLLGWRGPYGLDALGRHDRARQNFDAWTGRQNTDPIPAAIPPADEDSNLARNEAGLHSNGDLSSSHYDMNAVFIDALFRHLQWTGDRAYAREVWPVIERHLAWQRRLFRREFGPEKLPLYEAYAQIWASDDVQYSGGGVSYASAYNVFHNRMAARLAVLLGEDGAFYTREADQITAAMRAHLWLAEKGAFAEYKDWLGAQRVHESAGLWSFYHTIDSGVPTPREAWRMAEAIDRDVARIPVHGAGVPDDTDYHVLPTTDWMPYSWSVNNVVMGENLHTALGLWQAGRAEQAYRLTKSAILASMYMGIAPGNVGTMNYLDVYRRESQRDFADGSGVMSRAIVEGLFGVRPDALAGELRIAPGFPNDWRTAALTHPDVGMRFTRTEDVDRWEITQPGVTFSRLRLRVPAQRERVRSVEVDGRRASWRADPDAVGRPMLEIDCAFSGATIITIEWTGAALPQDMQATRRSSADFVRIRRGAFAWLAPTAASPRVQSVQASPTDWRAPPAGEFDTVDLAGHFNDSVSEIFRPGKYRSPRSPFVSLALPAQGLGAWAGHVNATAEIDDSGLRAAGRVLMPNGLAFATPRAGPNIVFTSQWHNYPREARIPLGGRARHAFLLMAGSTNHMQSRMDNGEVVFHYADGSQARLALRNPETWWPIDQDYFIDDYQFPYVAPLPARVDLRTGQVRLLDAEAFKGRGRVVPGGAATVLEAPLDPGRTLQALTLRALANDVVIGLMSVTLQR
jgi:Domain of unknown function (DUF4450)